MPPIKFQSDLLFGRRCRLKNFKTAALAAILEIGTERPSWKSERNDFSKSKSPCSPSVSYQVRAQFNLRFGSRCSLNFQDCRRGGHLGYRNRTILATLNLYVASMPLIKFLAQSDLQFGRRCRLKNFKTATLAAILDIGTEQF